MMSWVSVLTLCALVAADEAATPVMPIAEIRAMPMVEAAKARPVRVRGVVTLVAGDQMPAQTLVMQDDSAGIWVNFQPPLIVDDLKVGDEIEINGLTDRGGFSPTVLAKSLRRLGTRPLPLAKPVDDERFFSGSDTCHRIETRGIVQGFRDEGRYRRLILERGGRRFIATIPRERLGIPEESLIDATVRVSGVTTSRFNTRGEFLSPRISIENAADLHVESPPPSEPFTAPKFNLDAIAQFHPEPIGGHRIRTEGVVTFSLPGEYFFVQEGAVGVRVRTRSRERLEPGDRVEVAGFLDLSRTMAGLVEAVVRRIEATSPPAAAEITPVQLIDILQRAQRTGVVAKPGNYDGCLVRFPARLIDVERTRGGGLLVLSTTDQVNLTATLAGEHFLQIEHLAPGSDLMVTGIMQVERAEHDSDPARWKNPDGDRLSLILRTAADVVVVKSPSWWTPRRLAIALGIVGSVLAGALAWVWALRRQVAAQAARVAQEISTRREASVEFQATLRERNRLAANLHDTLLQSLAGIRFQLDACRVASRQGSDDESAEHFAVARRMLDHAAQNLRGSVWELRTKPVPGQSFPDSIDALIGQFRRAHKTQFIVRIEGEPVDVPTFIAGNLLLVAQEAIHNAVHHGMPGMVEVVVDFDPRAGMIDLVVHDDGAGFVKGAEVGPAQGHFGLQGMRERVERLGGTFHIESGPGQGTSVHVRVGVRAYDPQLEATA